MLDQLFMKPFVRLIDRTKIFVSPKKKAQQRHAPSTEDFSALIDPSILQNPSLHHVPPQPTLRVNPVWVIEKGDVRYLKMKFDSPIVTSFEENNTTFGMLIERMDRRNRFAFIMLHGWGRKNFRFEMWFCRALALRGIDTMLLTMPFHQERAPHLSWSGEYMVSGDVVRTEESFRQVVAEVRSIIPWMENRYPKLGMLGLSLGGVLAHLCMEFYPFSAGVTILGSGSNAHLVWESLMTRYVRADIEHAGISLEELDAIWAPSDPLKLAAFNMTENILMINGKHDEIVPPHLTVKIWEALGKPTIKWYPCAHYSSMLFMGSIIRDVANFATTHME